MHAQKQPVPLHHPDGQVQVCGHHPAGQGDRSRTLQSSSPLSGLTKFHMSQTRQKFWAKNNFTIKNPLREVFGLII